MFLLNSRQEIFRCGPSCEGQALSLTYGRFFAEFLEDLSLVRLSLLDLNTCVGLRYGRHALCVEGFLGTVLPILWSPVGDHCRSAWN